MNIPGFLNNAEIERLKDTYPELRSSSCPTCGGAGYFRWEAEKRVCVCEQQKRLHMRYLHAGIGATYQRLSWSDLKIPAEMYEPAMDWIEHADEFIRAGMGLLLHGPVGTGKTLLANLVLKELVKKDLDCYCTTFAGAVENFTATWRDNEEKKIFARRFMGSQVLVLDDLGKEFRSSTHLSSTTFDHILRTRVQNSRPTILTTNMTPRDMRGGYGGAVLSLLVEKSIEVPLSGADFRPASHDRTVAEIRNKEVRPIV
jgi:DNA replication protein DnaC